MARSKSSGRWLQEHFSDNYVKESQKLGYRSRAIFKLQELDEKDHFIKNGNLVIDLGAAPGAWSQYAAEKVGLKGEVIALDILPVDPIANVRVIEGDFTEQVPLDELVSVIDNRPVDVVMSDMAPNMSGIDAVDQPKSMYLVELAVEFADQVLKPGGWFISKVFQGEGFDELIRQLRQKYEKVKVRKPKASRPRSREVYVVAAKRKR